MFSLKINYYRTKLKFFEYISAKKEIKRLKDNCNFKDEVNINPNELTVLFCGDSITNATKINGRFSDLIIEKLRRIKKVKTITLAKDGVTSYYGVEIIKAALNRFKPNLIIINFFANDMDYLCKLNKRVITKLEAEESLKSTFRIISTIKERLPYTKIIIWGPTPTNEDYLREKRLSIHMMNIHDNYEAKLNIIIIKNISKMKEMTGIYYVSVYNKLKNKKYMKQDGIHPNEDGHKVISKLIFEKIKEIIH